MLDPFFITIVFIALAAIVAAFIRRTAINKCLKDFVGFVVTLEDTSGQTVLGKLRLENTGLELIYQEKRPSPAGHAEASYILYKHEYPTIQTLIRFHDDLTEQGKEQRESQLKRTYHPGPLRRLGRKIKNVFKTIRDSIVEILNLLISHAKKAAPVAATMTGQDKYVSQMKKELVGSVGTSYEPLLERYIGQKVVLDLIKGDKVFEYYGVLKDYTAQFIEIMDVDYRITEDGDAKRADLVMLRKNGIVRHLGE